MEREKVFSASKKDFKVEWFSGTGSGGQHRNKHQNCCRITHLPTNITVTGQQYRERQANLKSAFSRLASKLVALHHIEEDRSKYISDERVRTYHEPRNEVLDHASGVRLSYKEVVLDGNLGEMIDARHAVMCEKTLDKILEKDDTL
jgi:peptide chain release factor 1